mgnify:FL=1
MKKKIAIIALMLLSIIIPVKAFAKEQYKTLNLEETLAEEGIEKKFTDYKETDDQVIIYLFRGKGCAYCRKFLEFLNGITDEYGKYFKLVSFESWYNEENSNLLGEISTFMGEQASGVPYIIIGDKVFGGYTESYDESIKTAIKTLYDSKDRYDVFEEYEYSKKWDKILNPSNFTVIIWTICLVAVSTVVIVLTNRANTKKIVAAIENNKVSKTDEVKVEKLNNKSKKK